MIFCLGELDD